MPIYKVFIICLILIAPSLQAQELFSSKRILQGVDNEGPTTVLVADLDKDGRNDIICSSSLDNRVSWFRNLNNAGDFSPARVILEAPFHVYGIAIEDINLDGFPDILITSNADNRCYWIKNLGINTKFDHPKVINYNLNEPTSVISTDIDGDNINDVVFASNQEGKIVWHKNNNDTNNQFGEENIIENNLEGIYFAKSADMDNDGDMDIVAASIIEDVLVWYENTNGQGNFSSKKTIDSNLSGPYDFALADYDNDSYIDIALTEYSSGELSWYQNLQNKSFDSKSLIYNQYPLITSVINGDFDNDGDNDLAMALGLSNGLISIENNGSGNFGAADIISTDNKYSYSLAIGDFDNDGFDDIVAASFIDDNISWYRNDRTGHFVDEIQVNKSTSTPSKFQFADIDNDGNLDVITHSIDDTKLAWHRNLGGARGFGTQQIITTESGAYYDFAVTDINLDGQIDVITINAIDSTINIFYNIVGNNPFQHRTIDKLNGLPLSIITPDINADGLPDILVSQENNNRVYLYKNQGNLNFGSSLQLATNIEGVQHLSYADLNGDGNIDILVPARGDGTLVWYDNQNGTGGFGLKKIIDNQVLGIRWAEPADIDGDGDIDIVASIINTGKIVWYRNQNGGGNYSSAITLAEGLNTPTSITTGDFDLDGDMDIIASTLNGNRILYFKNANGNGSFSAAQLLSNKVLLPICINSMDFDGDGDLDLFYGARGTQEFGYFENWAINDCIANDFEVSTTECVDDEFNFIISSKYTSGLVSYSYFVNSFDHGVLNDVHETITDIYSKSAADVWTISIINDEDSTCEETYTIETPSCEETCSLSRLTSVVGDCNLTQTGFSALIDFDQNHPRSSTFDLLVDYQYFGNFSYSELPLNISDIPENSSGSSTITICDNDNDQCCISAEVASPCACSFLNITADVFSCDPITQEFYVLLDFKPNLLTGSFTIGGNQSTYGTYTEEDIPITIGPLSMDETYYDFLITDLMTCFANIEIGQVDCDKYANCDIQNMNLLVEECHDDGTFNLELNFDITNPINKDFDVLINGEYYQTLEYNNTSSYIISGLAGDCSTIYEVSITDTYTNTCSATRILQTPVCCDLDQCEFKNITINNRLCDANGNFNPTISFVNIDPVGTQFQILKNGVLIGVYDYGQASYPLGTFAGDCVSSYTITLRDAEDLTCISSINLTPLCCLDNCGIQDLSVSTECIENQTDIHHIDFDHPFESANTFTLKILNINMGVFKYNQLPLAINFEIPLGATIPFRIIDTKSQCTYTQSMPIECRSNCFFESISLSTMPCDDNGEFDLIINYTTTEAVTSQYSVFLNGTNYGTFDYNGNPITINNLAGDCQTIYEVQLIDIEDNTCYAIKALTDPICCTTNQCSISNIKTTNFNCLGDNEMTFELDFDFENVNSEQFSLSIGGTEIGNYNYIDLPISINLNNILAPGNKSINICDLNSTCCTASTINIPNCKEECNIVSFVAKSYECDMNQKKFSIYLEVNYAGDTNNEFRMYINDVLNNTYKYNESPILIENIPITDQKYKFGIQDDIVEDCTFELILDSIDCITPVITIDELPIMQFVLNNNNSYKLVPTDKSKDYQIEIFTINSQRVESKRWRSDYTIDINKYMSGMYIIRATIENKQYVYKMLIAQ